MNFIRRHLSYANVVSTMALVFAMGGTAIAANHYLITKTSQIKPSVLKKLEGKTGKTGPQGPAGTPGAAGAAGSPGTNGTNGLSALSTLPSGQSESGDYGIGTPGGKSGEVLEQAVTYPIPLAEGLSSSHTIYTAAPPVEHCSGPGHAEKGFLCVYSTSREFVNTQPLIKNPEPLGRPLGAGRLGFFLEWTITKKTRRTSAPTRSQRHEDGGGLCAGAQATPVAPGPVLGAARIQQPRYASAQIPTVWAISSMIARAC